MNNLESLLKQLDCKTPAEEIPSDQRDMMIGFLKREIEYRKQHKIKRLLSLSGIKHVKTLDQFDWHFNPGISKDDIPTFVHSPWIENAFNLVLIGDTGLGKSHIASSICYEAILQGFSTACITAFDLVSRIHKAFNPASRIDYYSKIRVSCIDELGCPFPICCTPAHQSSLFLRRQFRLLDGRSGAFTAKVSNRNDSNSWRKFG